MKSYKYILIAFIIAVVFISGCKKQDTGLLQSPFVGGTEGVHADFEEINYVSDVSQINEVYENEPFAVELALSNKGEYSVDVGKLTASLEGINTVKYHLDHNLTNENKLDKVTKYFPGGEDTIFFGDAYANITATDYVNLMAFYTYPYETQVIVPQVCFKGDLRETRLCNVDEDKQVFSSGAPVQVITSHESSAGAHRIRVVLDIINKGSGHASSTTDFNPTYDEVEFEVLSDGWECRAGTGGDKIRLRDGSGKLRCDTIDELPDDSLYMDQLSLKLKYYYQDIAQASLIVYNMEEE